MATAAFEDAEAMSSSFEDEPLEQDEQDDESSFSDESLGEIIHYENENDQRTKEPSRMISLDTTKGALGESSEDDEFDVFADEPQHNNSFGFGSSSKKFSVASSFSNNTNNIEFPDLPSPPPSFGGEEEEKQEMENQNDDFREEDHQDDLYNSKIPHTVLVRPQKQRRGNLKILIPCCLILVAAIAVLAWYFTAGNKNSKKNDDSSTTLSPTTMGAPQQQFSLTEPTRVPVLEDTVLRDGGEGHDTYYGDLPFLSVSTTEVFVSRALLLFDVSSMSFSPPNVFENSNAINITATLVLSVGFQNGNLQTLRILSVAMDESSSTPSLRRKTRRRSLQSLLNNVTGATARLQTLQVGPTFDVDAFALGSDASIAVDVTTLVVQTARTSSSPLLLLVEPTSTTSSMGTISFRSREYNPSTLGPYLILAPSTPIPTGFPSSQPSTRPSTSPRPSQEPSASPTRSPQPSHQPSLAPTRSPRPSHQPSSTPTRSIQPSVHPSSLPTTTSPTGLPTATSEMPSDGPSLIPSQIPSLQPSSPAPSDAPSNGAIAPSSAPTLSQGSSAVPSDMPSLIPSGMPSSSSIFDEEEDSKTTTTFCVIADVPYTPQEQVELMYQLSSESNQTDGCEFLVHLGDIMSAADACAPERYANMRNLLVNVSIPSLIVPGDNEWNDCGNATQIDAAWNLWMDHFRDLPKGETPFALSRQEGRPENFVFVHKQTLFIGLNLVGGSVHDEDEWNTRMRDQFNWVVQLSRQHIPLDAQAMVLLGHAHPGGGHARFFNPLKRYLDQSVLSEIPVLYLHGDGHEWIHRVAPPFLNNDNVLDIQHAGGTKDPILKIMVSPLATSGNLTDVFQYDRQLESQSSRTRPNLFSSSRYDSKTELKIND